MNDFDCHEQFSESNDLDSAYEYFTAVTKDIPKKLKAVIKSCDTTYKKSDRMVVPWSNRLISKLYNDI